jgi:very-short-patch-repair endonuclease
MNENKLNYTNEEYEELKDKLLWEKDFVVTRELEEINRLGTIKGHYNSCGHECSGIIEHILSGNHLCYVCARENNWEYTYTLDNGIIKRDELMHKCATCKKEIQIKEAYETYEYTDKNGKVFHKYFCSSDCYDVYQNKDKYKLKKITKVNNKEENIGRPKHKPSGAENYIKGLLWSNYINYIEEFSFYDSKNEHINNKQYDFAIFVNTILVCIVEYDGGQHDEPVDKFGGEEMLKYIQYSDKLKDKYCNEHNIKLIRIKSTDDFEKDKRIIFKTIEKEVLPLVNQVKLKF